MKHGRELRNGWQIMNDDSARSKKDRELTIVMDVQLTYILKDDAVLDISLEELQQTVRQFMSRDKAHTPWDDCHIKNLKVFDGGDE